MSAPNKEVFKNASQTTLNGAIDNSQTSITATDGSVFPSTGNFRLIIDSEILLCTARSTNTLTVLRGQEGSTAASHSNGANVTHIVTAASLARLVQDYVPLVGSDQPALARIVDDAGTGLLAASDFTDVNKQGPDSKTDQNGTILVRKAAQSGAQIWGLMRTAPSTPYSYIACFEAVAPVGATTIDKPNWGMLFRESSTGKLVTLQFSTLNADGTEPIGWRLTYHSGPTSAGTAQATFRVAWMAPRLWIRATDDGTNLIYEVSMDGENWIELLSVGRTAHMAGGADQIGWYSDNDSNDKQILVRLCHWSRV